MTTPTDMRKRAKQCFVNGKLFWMDQQREAVKATQRVADKRRPLVLAAIQKKRQELEL